MRGAWLVIALAACGDNLKAAAPDAPSTATLQFTPCVGLFECATLIVPVDYDAPDGATIALPVMRAKARNPDLRIGAITFNFGGPGGGTMNAIARSYPDGPLATPIDLTQYFDYVLIDWRGVATTSPKLTCYDASTQPRLLAQRWAPANDSDWTALFQLGTDLAAGCQANTSNAGLLLHQDSESAARDLDALRAGIGEDKLNMWVVSYGTRLGAMYATLFPEHAGAIVLDSPMAPVPDFKRFLMDQSVSFDDELTRFFQWCATATSTQCPFRTSDGQASSIAAAYESLLSTCDVTPVTTSGITLDRPTVNLVTTYMMYTPVFTWHDLATALAHLAANNGTDMAMLYQQGVAGFAGDDNGFSSYQNVMAQDVPLPSDLATPDAYKQWAISVGAAAPHVGLQNSAAQSFALSWPTPIKPAHAITATTAPPLLITATRHDPATPYAWALDMQTALANGSYLVTYEGDGHGNGSVDACLGTIAAQFLIDPASGPSNTDCSALTPARPVERPRFPITFRPGYSAR